MPRLPVGYSVHHNDDVDQTEEVIVSGPATLYGCVISNEHATADMFVQYYNSAAVTPGTTVPVITIQVPAQVGKEVEWVGGITFDTALSVVALTGGNDADTTGAATDDVCVSTLYLTGSQRGG